MQIDSNLKLYRTIDEVSSIPEGSMWLTDGNYRLGKINGILFVWPAETPDRLFYEYLQRLDRSGARTSAAGPIYVQSMWFSNAPDEGFGVGAVGYWKARFSEENVIAVAWNSFIYNPDDPQSETEEFKARIRRDA